MRRIIGGWRGKWGCISLVQVICIVLVVEVLREKRVIRRGVRVGPSEYGHGCFPICGSVSITRTARILSPPPDFLPPTPPPASTSHDLLPPCDRIRHRQADIRSRKRLSIRLAQIEAPEKQSGARTESSWVLHGGYRFIQGSVATKCTHHQLQPCVASSARTTTRAISQRSDRDASPCPRSFDTEDRIGVERMSARRLSCVTSDWRSSVLVSPRWARGAGDVTDALWVGRLWRPAVGLG